MIEEDSPDAAPASARAGKAKACVEHLPEILPGEQDGNPISDTRCYLKGDLCIVFGTYRNRQTTARPLPKEKLCPSSFPCKQARGFPREAVLTATFYITLPAKPR